MPQRRNLKKSPLDHTFGMYSISHRRIQILIQIEVFLACRNRQWFFFATISFSLSLHISRMKKTRTLSPTAHFSVLSLTILLGSASATDLLLCTFVPWQHLSITISFHCHLTISHATTLIFSPTDWSRIEFDRIFQQLCSLRSAPDKPNEIFIRDSISGFSLFRRKMGSQSLS